MIQKQVMDAILGTRKIYSRPREVQTGESKRSAMRLIRDLQSIT